MQKTGDFTSVTFPDKILLDYQDLIVKLLTHLSKNKDFATQISKGGEVLGKEIFPATEFAVGLFPSLSTLRAASKRGNKDDDEPDAFWFFQNDKIIMQANAESFTKAFPRLRELAPEARGGITQPRKPFRGPLYTI